MHNEQRTTADILQIAQVVPFTEAEGPGKRFAIWFQGCPLRCPSCCNPEYLPFRGGIATPITELVEQILHAHVQFGIEGITLIGGEPMAHAVGAAPLARTVQSHGLSVMVFTGFTLAEIHAKADPDELALLAATDLLIDGPFLREQPDSTRRWIGSTNQGIHCLSDRYRADDPIWRKPNTLEIRLNRDGEILINGFPAPQAVGLWKGLTRKRSARRETES